MDGDQYFNATFGPTNGMPDFQPFVMRNKGARGSPILGPGRENSKPFLPPSQNVQNMSAGDDSALSSHFSGMSLGGPQGPSPVGGKFQTPVKGRNPEASEFVPKSGGSSSRDSPNLTHSASTPSFSSFAHMPGLGSGNTIPNPVTAALAMSSGASPLASPGMSPQGSPMADRRRPQSPGQLQANATSTPTSASQMASLTTTPFQENVGGTTYFYTQEDLNAPQQSIVMPNFTMYPSILPHVAHMKPKSNIPSFFMPDEMKLEILNRHAMTLAQLDPDANLDIPQEVDKYHNLFPLEPPPANPLHKSSTFGYPTTCYRATNTKDGLPYCLRRIHGFRLSNNKCIALIDLWKKIQHSNIVQLREVFTTKAFGDHSMVFVYDFHPGSETLMLRHFAHSAHHMNGYNNPFSVDGGARPFSAKGGRGRMNTPRHGQGLLPESVIWSYIVQLSSALRTIHAHGLACRVMDPTKILLTDKSRIRMNCVGIFDILSFDASQANPLAMMPHYQQEDLVSMGKVVLALACNSIMGIQREHIQQSMELVSRNYSADLKNLILFVGIYIYYSVYARFQQGKPWNYNDKYLLTNQNRLRSVNDIMPMIGARFYTQLDSAQLRNDILENELAKEVENGRLFRILGKLGTISERPEFQLDPSWSETGDRYMLKLYRDYLFHQVDENGAPWIDMSHIVQSLNKLDSGSPEKVSLVSRDEQSVLVVSYAELKQFFEQSFNELQQAQAQSQVQQHHNGGYS